MAAVSALLSGLPVLLLVRLLPPVTRAAPPWKIAAPFVPDGLGEQPRAASAAVHAARFSGHWRLLLLAAFEQNQIVAEDVLRRPRTASVVPTAGAGRSCSRRQAPPVPEPGHFPSQGVHDVPQQPVAQRACDGLDEPAHRLLLRLQ